MLSRFNSTMVRLKARHLEIVELRLTSKTVFQFHNGSIKRLNLFPLLCKSSKKLRVSIPQWFD